MGKDEPFSNNNIHFNSRSKNKADVRSMGLNMYLHISPELEFTEAATHAIIQTYGGEQRRILSSGSSRGIGTTLRELRSTLDP